MFRVEVYASLCRCVNPGNSPLGLYWDNGKENGNYYLGLRLKGSGFRVTPKKS